MYFGLGVSFGLRALTSKHFPTRPALWEGGEKYGYRIIESCQLSLYCRMNALFKHGKLAALLALQGRKRAFTGVGKSMDSVKVGIS